MMKTKPFLFLSLWMILMLSCEFISGGGDAARTFSEKVETYPVSFKGSATVSVPYDAAVCVREGTATFFADDDQTCSLYVSYPRTVTNEQAQCVDAGDTEAWQLTGTFLKMTQACYVDRCNDNADYYAAGKIKFFPAKTEAATVSCALEKDGKTQVSIELMELKP